MARVTSTRRYQFQSVHSLHVGALSEHLHGHDFQLEVTVRGGEIQAVDEWVEHEILAAVHGRELNSLLDPATGEALVEWIDQRLRQSPWAEKLIGVALQETRKNRFVSARSEVEIV